VSKYQAYPEYKDSKNNWVSEIPSSWSVMRNKYLFEKKVVENIGELWKSTPLLSLTQKGVILKDINSGKGKTHSDYSTYQKINNNDLIFCLFDMDETPRTIGLSSYEGMITSAYSVFKTLAESEPKYIYYYYEHIDSFKGLKPFYTGLRKTVRPPTFLNVAMPMPSYAEQKNIANFLDKETTRIDTLIKKKTRFIELLKEKRDALISHAVTKGLNPDAEMKDSEAGWLGEVPKHWVVKSLRHIAEYKNSNVDKKTYDDQDSVRLCNYTDIYYNEFITDDMTFMKATASPSEIINMSLKCGDVVITKDSEDPSDIGIPALVKEDLTNVVCGYHLTVITAKNVEVGRFIYRSIDGRATKAHLYVNAPGITRYGLGQKAIGDINIALPPLTEMIVINNFIDDQTARIDALVEKTEHSIALLKEHRTALISAAVTGKIDVRNHTKNKNNTEVA